MEREDRGPPSIGKEHPAQMRDCGRSVNIRPEHEMASAFVLADGRPAGKKEARVGTRRQIAAFHARVFEGKRTRVGHARESVDGLRVEAAPYAIIAIGWNVLELVTKQAQRERFEEV